MAKRNQKAGLRRAPQTKEAKANTIENTAVEEQPVTDNAVEATPVSSEKAVAAETAVSENEAADVVSEPTETAVEEIADNAGSEEEHQEPLTGFSAELDAVRQAYEADHGHHRELARTKMRVAVTLVAAAEDSGFDQFNEIWTEFSNFVCENADGCFGDPDYITGTLRPDWVWDLTLAARFVALSTIAKGLCDSNGSPADYFETVNLSALTAPPTQFTSTVVENFTKLYQL